MRVLCTRVLRKWLDLRPEIIQLLQFRNWPQSSASSPQRLPDQTRPETSPDRTSPYQARRPSQTFPSSLFSSRRHINHFCLLISFGFGFVCSSFLFRCFRFSFFVVLLFFFGKFVLLVFKIDLQIYMQAELGLSSASSCVLHPADPQLLLLLLQVVAVVLVVVVVASCRT